MACLYCAQDLHLMCDEDGECCCKGLNVDLNDSKPLAFLAGSNSTGNPVGRPMKDSGFTDLLSTGRKRAAQIYAIQPGQICAWAWQKNCGGGVVPIVGCSGRPAKNIHHGPDKSVLNNAPDNISVVCAHCHNKWHADNDPLYVGERPTDGSAWLQEGIVHALSEIEPADAIEILNFEISMKRTINREAIEARISSS